MATVYKYPQWLMPENSNQDKVSNYSFEFDGVDDYIDITPSYTLSGEFGISVWFKNDVLGFDGMLLGKAVSGTNSLLWLYNTTKIWISFGGSTATFNNDGTNPIPTGGSSWANLLVWRDDTDTVHCYLNNQNFGTLSIVSPTQSNDFTFDRIGGAAATYFWKGNIDEVSIYNRAFSSEDRNTIYNSGTPTTLPSGAIAHYKMGEQSTFTDNWLVNNSALTNYSTRSFSFDGVDDYIDCGQISALENTSTFTLSEFCLLYTSDAADDLL